MIVAGRVLACGCLVGDYVTWRGSQVCILDGLAPSCTNESHQLNGVLASPSSDGRRSWHGQRGVTDCQSTDATVA